MHSLRRDYVEELALHKETEDSGQMICFNCEEIVSRLAQSCPYCRVPLVEPLYPSQKTHLKGCETEKITPFQSSAKEKPVDDSLSSFANAPHHHLENQNYKILPQGISSPFDNTESLDQNSPLHYLASLLFFLLGGAFFFFGISIPLFAKDGCLVLIWDECMWTPFIGCGLILISSGYFFLRRIEQSFDE